MKLKYNLKNILVEDDVNLFGYGNNPHLPSDVADYSNDSDVDEELGSDSYDRELDGYEAMEKISQKKANAESRKKDFWKHLFNKIAKQMPATGEPDEAPEDDIKPVWNQFIPMQETDS